MSTFLCGVIFTGLLTLAIVSHVKTMTTDPGVVLHESTTEEEIAERRRQGEDVRYCKKCRSVKPDRAHHCSTCEHCIHRMDHHCPWVNNCVGENNQKYFVLFTFYVMATSIFGLGVVGLFFFNCAMQNFEGCDAFLPAPLVFILMIMGVFEGFLFSLFTCIMFCTQVHSIITDETGIEQLKKETRAKRRWYGPRDTLLNELNGDEKNGSLVEIHVLEEVHFLDQEERKGDVLDQPCNGQDNIDEQDAV
ncbi:palmitoyltransferase ZDHHC3-like, partial [Gigantopelta aegis]|uniref:palmitoyltransferase ZDHHC3-like n=1 Tax=Gigantopelta aegis TaxID=1735272 RepID=UPI001B88ABFB